MGKTLAVLNPSTRTRQSFAGITWEWRGFNGQVGNWVALDVAGEPISGLYVRSLGTSVQGAITSDDPHSPRAIVMKTQKVFCGPMPIASVYSRRDQRYFDAMQWASEQYQQGAMWR